MHYGFKIVQDMADGLNHWMDSKGYAKLTDFMGKAIPNVKNWNELDLNFKTIAKINQDECINCGLCYIACEDTSHQAISKNGRRYDVIDAECVGCNLCNLVCPADCITMVPQPQKGPYLPWTKHPNNPMAVKA
jgi:dihydropyrimidine dehydrogenase (NAD+) subunit PreA